MKKGKLYFLGVVSFVLGALMLLNSFSGFTGFYIVGELNVRQSSILTFAFFVSSVIFFIVAREHSGLEEYSKAGVRITPTRSFMKDVGRHPLSEINNAISKIGTGAGKEEHLRGGGYSIRTSKGGRIIYDRDSDRSVTLTAYTPDHNYKRAMRGRN